MVCPMWVPNLYSLRWSWNRAIFWSPLSQYLEKTTAFVKSAKSLCLGSIKLYAPQTKFLADWTKDQSSFQGTLLWIVSQIEYSHPRKEPRKIVPDLVFRLQKLRLGAYNYMLPKRSLCSPNGDFWKTEQSVACAFSMSLSTTRVQIEYSNHWNVHRTCTCYALFKLPKSSFREHKVTLFTLPKRRFWKPEQSVACAFLNEFSMIRRPSLVLTPLKSTSKTHTQRSVRASKIFVWGA